MIAIVSATLSLHLHVPHAVRRAPPPVATELFSAEALEAMRAELEVQAAARRAEARVELDAEWDALAASLPVDEPSSPVLTLYRDTNGWCPFCERVWLQLLIKGIPFNEELIDLRDKPEWYKEMVPTTLVPAELVLHASFEMEQAQLPPRGASSHQRQGVGLGAVVMSEADHDVTMEELKLRQAGER